MNKKILSVISVLLCAVLLCGTMSAAALPAEKPRYVVLRLVEIALYLYYAAFPCWDCMLLRLR